MTVTKTPLYRKVGNSYARVYCEKANWKECREHKNDTFILPPKATITELETADTGSITLAEYAGEQRTGTGIGGIEYEKQILTVLSPFQK